MNSGIGGGQPAGSRHGATSGGEMEKTTSLSLALIVSSTACIAVRVIWRAVWNMELA